MFRNILIGLLALVIIGIAVWGYQEHRDKNAILINAENNYQRAFHELTYHIDVLHDKIGTTLAMNSRNSLSPTLAEVWRIASQAHSEVGQLPLTLLPFNKTEEFLANVGEFSYKTAVRDLEKEPLTKEEYQTLQDLYEQSAEIQTELRKVQHMVLNHNLRWMDVELALATNKEPRDNTIIDGLKTVEKKAEGYSDTDFGVSFTGSRKKDESFRNLEGREITRNEAAAIAKKFTGFTGETDVKVTENGKGSDYGFYSVSIRDKKTNEEADMDITKKGGRPIWYLLSKDIKEQKISLNEASQKAKQFLQEHDFENLDLFESVQYDHVGVFNFVSKENNVRIYPDSIIVKVALDDGRILGFSAENYLKSNHVRRINKPAFSKEEARKKINPNVEIMEEGLAIIENDMNEEVLCYEFLGILNDETYRIFINADNGNEEKVEKLQNAEPIYEEAI